MSPFNNTTVRKTLFYPIIFICLFLFNNTLFADDTCTGDCINGHGEITLGNGDKYEGEFKNDKAEGQGTFTYSSGKKYTGKFKDGQPVKTSK